MPSFAGSLAWFYTAWAEYGPAGTTLVAALVGVVAFQQWRVAVRQAKVAQEKLRLDLFARRWAVYDAVQKARKAAEAESFGQAEQDVYAHLSGVFGEATFLFDHKDMMFEKVTESYLNFFS